MITEFNGKPIANRDELIRMVTATKPGTTVPMKLMRDKKERTVTITVEELDLEAESRRAVVRRGRRARTRAPASACRCGDITPPIARQLRLPAGMTGALIIDVDPGSAAEGGGLAQYDVILKVNGTSVVERRRGEPAAAEDPVGRPRHAARLEDAPEPGAVPDDQEGIAGSVDSGSGSRQWQ